MIEGSIDGMFSWSKSKGVVLLLNPKTGDKM